MMKYVMAILMLVVLMVGCAPSCNTVPTQPQLPVAVDNKSTPIATVVVPLRDSKSTQTVNVIAQDVTENALKSTALIFSTNQLWADKARTNFWDEISQYQGIAGQRFGSIPNINSHYWTQGTGVIIDKNGYILTNRNNLECNAPCDKAGLEGTAPMFIYVFIFEQGSLSISPSRAHVATVIGKLPHDDLAVIKIAPPIGDLPYVPLGDSDALTIGQKVAIINYSMDVLTTDPDNIFPITAEGTISSITQADTYPINYYVDEHYTAKVIQMSAPVDRRDKGSPVINKSGELVGLIISRLIYQDNLGFAIAINEAKDLIKASCISPSATPPTQPEAEATTPIITAKPVSWGDSVTYANDKYGVRLSEYLG